MRCERAATLACWSRRWSSPSPWSLTRWSTRSGERSEIVQQALWRPSTRLRPKMTHRKRKACRPVPFHAEPSPPAPLITPHRFA